jgi:ribosomal-protein-alanine N-acetyltransferase
MIGHRFVHDSLQSTSLWRQLPTCPAKGFCESKSTMMKTQRLTLRELEAGDWRQVLALLSNPEVIQYTLFPLFDQAEARNFVAGSIAQAREELRGSYVFAILPNAEGLLIGICGFIVNHQQQSAEIWYLEHQQYWGKGYMTEVARALLQFGFEQLGLHCMWAHCVPCNLGSVRVLEKIGMRREGQHLENLNIQGKWEDTYHYAILDREWKSGSL